MRFVTLILPLALLGCTQFPELDRAVSEEGKAAPYPTLVPVDDLLSQRKDDEDGQDIAADLEARLNALQNRADKLRAAKID